MVPNIHFRSYWLLKIGIGPEKNSNLSRISTLHSLTLIYTFSLYMQDIHHIHGPRGWALRLLMTVWNFLSYLLGQKLHTGEVQMKLLTDYLELVWAYSWSQEGEPPWLWTLHQKSTVREQYLTFILLRVFRSLWYDDWKTSLFSRCV